MRIIKLFISFLINAKLKREYTNRVFRGFNERPVEFAFVFKMLAKYYPKTVLDVGTGRTALPHLIQNCGMLVTAIDNIKDYWSKGMVNRHYYVMNESILSPKHSSKYDMVFCISVLEHIEDHNLAVQNMMGFLNDGGHLVMTFPASGKKYVRNCYDLPDATYGSDYKYIAQSFSPDEIEGWCMKFGLEEIESEYWQFWTKDYWTCGEYVVPPKKMDSNDDYQIRCICLEKKRPIN